MTGFRRWLAKCCVPVCGDYATQNRAYEILGELQQVFSEDHLSLTGFGINVLQKATDIAKVDSTAILKEFALPIVNYLGGIPFFGLLQLNNEGVDPRSFKKFFKDNFGKQYSRIEMDSISVLLKLPDNQLGWKNEDVLLTAYSGRLVSDAPPLARPCIVQVKDLAYLHNAQLDFEDIVNSA